MSNLLLHMRVASPPCCAVRMLGEILGLKFQMYEPNLLELEHRTPEFKKKNPMATIPVLEDGDFIISESHAIMKYLLEQYGGEHREALYPSAAKTRAMVDQCMFYDAGVFYNRLRVVALPTFMHGLPGPSTENIQDIEESFAVLEAFLTNKKYIATNHITLADLSVGSTATATQVVHKLDSSKYPRCSEWLQRLNDESYFKNINAPGVSLFNKILNSFWRKNRKNKST